MKDIKNPLVAEALLRKSEKKSADFELRNKASKFKLTEKLWLSTQK